MNRKRLPIRLYYFSVEGETEYWYLMWLQDKVNEEGSCRVKFDVKIEKSPLKRTRGLSIIQKTDIWHFCDYESPDEVHVRQFMNTMDEMIESGTHKQVKYHLGYSNYTFDLWIILHKKACNGPKADRRQYITEINNAFQEHFEDMHQYKHENNFKRCLSELTLENVKSAISRAQIIMNNRINSDEATQYRTFRYYKTNPSLAVHEIIAKILADCGLM